MPEDIRRKAYDLFKEAYPKAEYTAGEFSSALDDSSTVERVHSMLSEHYEMSPLEEFKQKVAQKVAGKTTQSVNETVEQPTPQQVTSDKPIKPHPLEILINGAYQAQREQQMNQELEGQRRAIEEAAKKKLEEDHVKTYPQEVQEIIKREGKMPTSVRMDEDTGKYTVVFGKSPNAEENVQMQVPSLTITGTRKPVETKEQEKEVQKLLNSVNAQRAAISHFENAPPGISTPSNASEIKSQNFYDWVSQSTGKEIKSFSDVKKELGKDKLTDSDLEVATKKYVLTSSNFTDANRVIDAMPTSDKLNTHPVGRLATSFVSGGVAVTEGTLGALEWGGSKTAGTYADKLKKWNEEITPKNQGFIEQVAGGLGSQIVFIPFGVGVGTMARLIGRFSPKIASYFAAGGSSFLEASTEAGLVYRTLKQDGKSDKEASTGATYTFLANIPLDFITDKIGVFGEHKVGKVLGEAGPLVGTAMAEGIQESGQQVISNMATNRQVGEDVAASGAVGALTGGLTQSVMSNPANTDAIQKDKAQEQPTPSVPTVSQETKMEGEPSSATGKTAESTARTSTPPAPVTTNDDIPTTDEILAKAISEKYSGNKQRVIAPNGEEVTLVGESETDATIQYDDGVVEQHPIDDIQKIPESKSEILGSQEPTATSETQGSSEAALAEQEKNNREKIPDEMLAYTKDDLSDIGNTGWQKWWNRRYGGYKLVDPKTREFVNIGSDDRSAVEEYARKNPINPTNMSPEAPIEIAGEKIKGLAEPLEDGTEVFETESGRFITRDGKELNAESIKQPTQESGISEGLELKDVDAQIRKITRNKDGSVEVEIGTHESLGEQGGDILTYQYDSMPDEEEIRQNVREEYSRFISDNAEGVLGGREESQIENARRITLSEPLSDGTEVFETEGGRFVTRDGKEVAKKPEPTNVSPQERIVQPEADNEATGKPFEQEKAYRVPTGVTNRGKSAKDIVDFEADELGNEEVRDDAQRVAEEHGIDLSKVSAKDVVWVTRTEDQAAQLYAYDNEGKIPEKAISEYSEDEQEAIRGRVGEVDTRNTIVLHDLGNEGVLLLRNPEKYKPPRVENETTDKREVLINTLMTDREWSREKAEHYIKGSNIEKMYKAIVQPEGKKQEIPAVTPKNIALKIERAVADSVTPYVMIQHNLPEGGRFVYEAYNAITGEKIAESKRISGEGSISSKLSKRKGRYEDVFGAFHTFANGEKFSLDKFYQKDELIKQQAQFIKDEQEDTELMRVPKGQKPSDILKARESAGDQVYGMPMPEAERLLDAVKKGLQERQGDVSKLKIESHPEAWRDEKEISVADDLSTAYNGKKVVWFSGFDAQGFFDRASNTIWINVQATDPAQKVFAHELGHFIDTNHPELYDIPFKMFLDEIKDRQELFDYYEKKYGHDNFYEALDNALKTGRKGILGEAFNDLMAERMQDVEFWKKLYAENPDNTRSLIDRIREFIRSLKAKAEYKVARFLRNQGRVLDAIDDMMIQFDRMMRGDTVPEFKDSTEAMLWGRRNPEKLPQLEELRKKKEFAISIAKRNYGHTSLEASKAVFAHQLVNEAITFAKNPTKKTIAEEMGLVAPAFMPKEVRQQWYYSQMEKVLERDLPNAGMPDIYSKTIEAYVNAGKFKKEEFEWSGVQEWLKKQTGKVSKQQVLDYLAQNNVQVKEVVKGSPDIKTKITGTPDGKFRAYFESDRGWNDKILDTRKEAEDWLKDRNSEVEYIGQTKYHGYQLPGGKNYRELLLTLPEKSSSLEKLPEGFWITENPNGGTTAKKFVVIDKAGNRYGSGNTQAEALASFNRHHGENYNGTYRGGHFDEPNVLVHVRFNDRIDAAGKKTLFLEELQSDWHQKGRKEGYKQDKVILRKSLEEVRKGDLLDGKYGVSEVQHRKDGLYFITNGSTLWGPKDNLKPEQFQIGAAASVESYGVPNAPFKTTWQEMAFRRMVRYAVENGYNKIAWTTGEQQAARYDLSKQIDNLSYDPKTKELKAFRGTGPNKQEVISRTSEPGGLPDIIGKEAARKILEQPLSMVGNQAGMRHWLHGQELSIGGEGMKGFYDKILVDYANKFGKKFGSKVEDANIKTDSPEIADKFEGDISDMDDLPESMIVHSLPITPEMRSTALYEGLPLFQRFAQDATDDYYENLKKETIFNSSEKRGEAKEYAIRRLQDYLRPLKQLQKQKEATGKAIPDEMNAYEKETLMYRRVQERFEELHKVLFASLNDAMATAKKAGASLGDVRDYMMALHAPERNAYIRKKRVSEITYAEEQLQKPNLSQEKREKFEDKLEFLNAGSGMTDADAVEVIGKMDKRGLRDTLDDVARAFKAITRFDLDNRLEYGLISKETHDELSTMFEHYMPLRGFAEDEYDESRAHTGRGFDVRGKEWKTMYGRKSEAGDILSYALLQAEEGIIRGEKNLVQRAFYDFVIEYPDLSQYELEKWYFVRQVDKVTGKLLTDEDGKAIYKAQSARPSRDEYASGRVKWGGVDEETEIIEDFDRTRITSDKKVVGLKVDGKQVYIKIKDEKLAQALQKLGIERTGIVLNSVRKVLQAQRQFITTLSPEFGIGNFERDIQEALLNLNAKFDTDTVVKILKDVPSAMNGLIQHGRRNYKNAWATTAKIYFYKGGGTGFIESKDMEKRTKELVKMFKEAGKSNAWIFTKDATKAILGAVEAGNDVIENGIRLATYNHLVKEKGWSEQKALVFSKELTVNFNRKGEIGNVANAMYLFFNTQIQGTARLLSNFSSDDPRRRKRAIYQAVVLSMSALFLSSLFRILGGKDDDDVYYYDKESDWTRQHNILIPLPGEKNFFPVKLPYGYNIFWALGDNALRAGTDGKIGSATLNIMSTALDSFNPMGSNESKTLEGRIGKALSPTILDPLLDIWVNEDFMANRIRPEDPFNTEKPRSEKYFRRVSPQIKAVTDALNKATGGDKVIPGFISVSPEDVEYIIQFYTGGTGKFVMNSVKTVSDLVTEGKTDVRNIPMARVVLHRTPSERFDQQQFYENVNEVKGRIDEIKSLAEEKDNNRAAEIVKEYKPILSMSEEVGRVETIIKRLNKIERRLTNQDSIDKIEKEKASVRKGFNKRYSNALKMIGR